MAPDRYTCRATERMHQLEGVRLASFSRRAAAFSIDFLLVGTVLVAAVLAGAAGASKAGFVATDTKIAVEFGLTNWYSVAALAAYFGIATYIGNGQTLGKRLLRIQVLSTLDARLTLWQSVSRALGYATSALELGFGFLKYFFMENRQTTHDRLAGTIVVVNPGRPRRWPSAPARRPPPAAP